jgi:tetratricopeptide (TPR) repeat protein
MMKFFIQLAIVLMFSIHYCFGQDGNTSFNTAKQLYAQKNYNGAYTSAAQAVQQNPADINCQILLGEIQYHRSQNSDALRLLKNADVMNTNIVSAKVKYIDLLYKSNQFEEVMALSELIKKEKFEPEDELIFLRARAKSLYQQNIYPEAIKVYEVLLPKETNQKLRSDYYLKLAESYDALTQFEKSLPYYEKSWQLDSTNPKASYNLGIQYYNASQYTNALKSMERAANLGYKTDKEFYYLIGNIHYDRKDYVGAIAALGAARKISPYDQDVASLLAFSYYHNNDLSESRTILDDMLKINAENADALYLYGLTYQKQEKLEKAERYFEKAFKIKPALQQLKVSKMRF